MPRPLINSHDDGETPLHIFLREQGAKLVLIAKETITEHEIDYGIGLTDGRVRYWTLYKR